MKKLKMKTLLFGIAFTVSLTLAGLSAVIPNSHASDEHGDDHDHQEDEEKHDEDKEEKHGHGHEDDHGHEEGKEESHDEGSVSLNDEQITTAGIIIAVSGSGVLSREVSVPGKIVAAADHMARVVPKVAGTVTEARKNLGDTVERGEVLALIESREMAEAVADHLAARRAEELSRTTFEREKVLWDKKITAEQDYLMAKNAHQESVIRLDLTKQKLQALGHQGVVSANPNSRFYELKSPISGRVIERELTLGEYVDSTHTAYAVADLGTVWVETAIAPGDLPFVQEGQVANVTGSDGKGTGKLIFVSPTIDPETRAAKAIIEIDNQDGAWRPGGFANAFIATSAQKVGVLVPKEAIQAINGKPVIFIRTDKGFQKREITTGREDSRHVEIVSGLSSGDAIAVSNSFVLKAELGKSEAEHAH